MNTAYWQRWVRAKKCPVLPLSEEEARERHARREPYVVVLSEGDQQLCFIELTKAWIAVSFMDDLKRPYLTYEFVVQSTGDLFLTASLHRDYAGQSGDVERSTTFKFHPDGLMTIHVIDHKDSVEQESEKKVDPSTNWDSYPSFGDYSKVARLERT